MKKLIAITLVLCLVLRGCALDLGEYIREQGIDMVLILYSFETITQEQIVIKSAS